MGIRLPSISLTKHTVLFAAQLVVNVSLALWLYSEYLHNPFMQAYVSTVWSSIWPGVAVVAGVAVGATAILLAYSLGHLPMLAKNADQIASVRPFAAVTSLETIDSCPFCETPLKTISEGRLQCRNCRRYFKSSMPKIIA